MEAETDKLLPLPRVSKREAAGFRKLAHHDQAQDRKRITTKAETLSRPGYEK
jgi:hypothetical protein